MLGQRLQTALKSAGVSASDAASYIGVSEANLYKIFKKDSFEVAYLRKAAELLKLPLGYFFDEGIGNDRPQIGDFNQSGGGNFQKVKVSKAPTQELASQLDSCQREVEHLKEKLVYANQTIASKDETISLLRGSYNRPN